MYITVHSSLIYNHVKDGNNPNAYQVTNGHTQCGVEHYSATGSVAAAWVNLAKVKETSHTCQIYIKFILDFQEKENIWNQIGT